MGRADGQRVGRSVGRTVSWSVGRSVGRSDGSSPFSGSVVGAELGVGWYGPLCSEMGWDRGFMGDGEGRTHYCAGPAQGHGLPIHRAQVKALYT